MPLTAGFRIGPYEIVSLLGVGGMGEVYRARDTRLGRDVAIKSLPDLFAGDPERVARFEREAQVLASLNHPHIAGIYGLEQVDNHRFLILEFIEGQSLANRLAAGPLPLEDALAIARQLLDALETAHEKGIVHRDIKPANIMLTADSVLKVLDFGLARVVESNPTSSTSNSPTLTFAATQVGVILGTAAYMAPEQAKGRVADKRSDVWAFGCVLYEMLTGKRVFEGEDVSDTLAAVLRADPDWSALPAAVPPGVRIVLKRCLDRDRKARIPEVSAVRFLLQDASAEPAAPVAAAVQRPVSWSRIAAAALAVVALAAGAAIAAWYLKPAPAPPRAVTRFLFTLPPNTFFTSPGRRLVAISPDGMRFLYNAERRLIVRSLAENEARAIPGSEVFEGDLDPVFSPDGQAIAFFANSEKVLKRIAVTGGVAVTLGPTEIPYGITWSKEGIAVGQGAKGILLVSPDGGTPRQIVTVKDGEVAYGPQLLQDGASVLFTLAAGTSLDRWDKAKIVLQSLTSGERRTIVDGGTDARYLPQIGRLVYAVSGSLFAVSFDPATPDAKGRPVPVVEGVRRSTAAVTGAAQYSVSDDGTLVYIPGPASTSGAIVELMLSNRKGEVEALKLASGLYETPRVSPDGKRVAFSSNDAIWTYELSGASAMQRLTFGGKNRFPIWSADGKHIAFQSDREGDLAVFWQLADGSGTAERLTQPAQGEVHTPMSWALKGADRFLFDVTKGTDTSISMFSLRDRKAVPFGQVHSATPTGAIFSPDARWVAYSSTEQGRTTVYVQSDPPTSAKYQLFAKGGDGPHEVTWSPDGKEIFYNPRPGGFEAVTVITQPTFAFGNPVAVPRQFGLGPPSAPRAYDVTPDGKFVGLGASGRTDGGTGGSLLSQIQVVVNWFEEVRARVK
jgi:serine/threonine-protein kinase